MRVSLDMLLVMDMSETVNSSSPSLTTKEFNFFFFYFAGNLHLNIVADQYSEEIQNALEPFVYELVGMYY